MNGGGVNDSGTTQHNDSISKGALESWLWGDWIPFGQPSTSQHLHYHSSTRSRNESVLLVTPSVFKTCMSLYYIPPPPLGHYCGSTSFAGLNGSKRFLWAEEEESSVRGGEEKIFWRGDSTGGRLLYCILILCCLLYTATQRIRRCFIVFFFSIF